MLYLITSDKIIWTEKFVRVAVKCVVFIIGVNNEVNEN